MSAFRLSRVAGRCYENGNLVFGPEGSTLYSPVGNQVSVFDLLNHGCSTLPEHSRMDIVAQDIHPDGKLLVTVDSEGHAVVTNLLRNVSLGHFNFKGRVSVLRFSPDGSLLAVGVDRRLQLFHAPQLLRQFVVLRVFKKFGGLFDSATCLAWSPDSRLVFAGGRDLVIRVFEVRGTPPAKRKTLFGHREPLAALCVWQSQLFSLSQDGALFRWSLNGEAGSLEVALEDRMYIEKDADRVHLETVSAAGFSGQAHALLLVVGFRSGAFALYQLPDFQAIHSLRISDQPVSSVGISPSGALVAVGTASRQQLLVWDWRSETCRPCVLLVADWVDVLKQQGHSFSVDCLAFSPDGRLLASGGDDCKVKLWNTASGFCFVTFSDHTGPITGLSFTGRGSVVVSASLDGTVKAFDLTRYRCFRSLTAPESQQFSCVACDGAGDLVAAGGKDPFSVYVWALRTAKLLQVLSGHEGPIASLTYSQASGQLVSGSWDKTVRVWDFLGGGGSERLQHGSEVLSVALGDSGTHLCTVTLGGQLCFWDIATGKLMATVDATRDVMGGRVSTGTRTADSAAKGKHFVSTCFAPQEQLAVGVGNSKWVCVYDPTTRSLVKRLQLSFNRSLEGVADLLNSKLDVDGADVPSSTTPADASLRKKHRTIGANCVEFSPTGEMFVVASTEGLVFFSNRSSRFEPLDFDVDVTPQRVAEAFREAEYEKALILALRLNQEDIVCRVLVETPQSNTGLIAGRVPKRLLLGMLHCLAKLLAGDQHVERALSWCESVFMQRGYDLRQDRTLWPSLRNIRAAIRVLQEAMCGVSQGNRHLLRAFGFN